MTTQYEADIINKERQRMADQMTEKLQKLGVEVRVAHYTGDSSYPTEYTISFQGISYVGPTFDLALMGWIEKLVEVSREPAGSYQAMETALRVMAGGLSSMRTELLVIKEVVVKDSEQEDRRADLYEEARLYQHEEMQRRRKQLNGEQEDDCK